MEHEPQKGRDVRHRRILHEVLQAARVVGHQHWNREIKNPVSRKILTVSPDVREHRYGGAVDDLLQWLLAEEDVPDVEEVVQGKLAPEEKPQPATAEDYCILH